MAPTNHNARPEELPSSSPIFVSATWDCKPKAKPTVGVSKPITTQKRVGIPLPTPPRPRPRPVYREQAIPSTSKPPPPTLDPTPVPIPTLANNNIDTSAVVATSATSSPAHLRLAPPHVSVLPGSTPAPTPCLVNNPTRNMDLLAVAPTASPSMHTPAQVQVQSALDGSPQPEPAPTFVSSPAEASFTNLEANFTASHSPTRDHLTPPLPSQIPIQTSSSFPIAPLSLSKGNGQAMGGKRIISDDLAMSDLEWLKTKPKRKSSSSTSAKPMQVQIIDLTKDEDEFVPPATGVGAGVGMSEIGPLQPALKLASEVEVKTEDEGDVQEIRMNVGVDTDKFTPVNGDQPCIEEPKPMACYSLILFITRLDN